MKVSAILTACAGGMLALAISPARAQTVYLCQGEGRSFAVAGRGAAPPDCRELAEPDRELLLSPAQPDIGTLARDLALLSQRVARLEALLAAPVSRSSPLSRPAVRPDVFDTRGRTRDLGQDIDRRLDAIGR